MGVLWFLEYFELMAEFRERAGWWVMTGGGCFDLALEFNVKQHTIKANTPVLCPPGLAIVPVQGRMCQPQIHVVPKSINPTGLQPAIHCKAVQSHHGVLGGAFQSFLLLVLPIIWSRPFNKYNKLFSFIACFRAPYCDVRLRHSISVGKPPRLHLSRQAPHLF